MFGLKSVVAAVTVATMVASSAFAADGALKTGRPAGVKSAQEIGTGTLIIGIGAAAIITGIAIVVTNQSGGQPAQSAFSSVQTTSIAP